MLNVHRYIHGILEYTNRQIPWELYKFLAGNIVILFISWYQMTFSSTSLLMEQAVLQKKKNSPCYNMVLATIALETNKYITTKLNSSLWEWDKWAGIQTVPLRCLSYLWAF